MTTPVTIRGVDYPSMTAAAKALGVSVNAIHNARNEGRLDTCELGPERRRRPVTVYDDILDVLTEYPNLKGAAEHVGVSYSALCNHCARARKAGRDYIRVHSYGVSWDD